MPEVTLGVLPAWGGTTRLIRLTSLPNALKVMLTGSQFAAKPALKLGLVDKVVHYENLIHESKEIWDFESEIEPNVDEYTMYNNSFIM